MKIIRGESNGMYLSDSRQYPVMDTSELCKESGDTAFGKGAETWTLRATDQKRLESFEMWCCRRTEKISWTDHVRNEEVLLKSQ